MAVATAAALVVPMSAGASAEPSVPHPGSAVVVAGASAADTAAAVEQAGGTVVRRLGLVHGVEARLPTGAALPAGYRVTPDRALTLDAEPDAASSPLSTVRETVGLPATGDEGDGVTVALVDTGVNDAPDLAGRVEHVDVTGTGTGDGYGHGTFMAGVIAGSGAASSGRYQGLAPQARVLDVKVAEADGTTSLTRVLRGLQAVEARAAALDVRVLNLSLSSYSPLPYQVDPLNVALRHLWRRGVTVVTPAGNDGPAPGTVTSPGNDPLLLTVGALDEAGTAGRADDTVAEFSGRGPTAQRVDKPDLAAPGVGIVSVRPTGTVVDEEWPAARVGADYFRGSGTSMSAAVTSGAAAGVLARRPGLRPDQVKALLTATAYAGSGLGEAAAAGAGGLDVAAALAALPSPPTGRQPADVEPLPAGDEAAWEALARAMDARDPDAVLAAWKALSPAGRAWAGRVWRDEDWAGRVWRGRVWRDEDWAGRVWRGRVWRDEDWAGRVWRGRVWRDEDWAGRVWRQAAWSADSWASDCWAGRWG